jgi:type II secretory pathway component PulJ
VAKQLTESELLYQNLVKAVRSSKRLKYSILADRELNEVIPQLEKDFMAALKAGREEEFAIESALAAAQDVAPGVEE